MKTDIWMPIYIGDYLADTQHLTPEKHGIYLLLMMHYWKQGPLENDLEELACVTRAKEETLLKVLVEFFVLDGEVWRHGRIDKERAKASAKRTAAQASARKRWDKHTESENDANAYPKAVADGNAKPMQDSMLNGCSSPSPSPSPSPSSSSSKSQSQSEEKRGKRASRFTPPTVEEVQAYCQERGNQVDSVQFVNFYGAKGWMIGKNKMKDWKKAVHTWEQRDQKDRKPDQYNMGVARVEGF